MGKRFLTLDTNVLINHLDLVRKTFIALSSAGSEASLLVPTVVINGKSSCLSVLNSFRELPGLNLF